MFPQGTPHSVQNVPQDLPVPFLTVTPLLLVNQVGPADFIRARESGKKRKKKGETGISKRERPIAASKHAMFMNCVFGFVLKIISRLQGPTPWLDRENVQCVRRARNVQMSTPRLKMTVKMGNTAKVIRHDAMFPVKSYFLTVQPKCRVLILVSFAGGRQACLVCPAGYACPNKFANFVLMCQSGYYSDDGDIVCTECPVTASCVKS